MYKLSLIIFVLLVLFCQTIEITINASKSSLLTNTLRVDTIQSYTGITVQVASNLYPSVHNNFELGDPSLAWSVLFVGILTADFITSLSSELLVQANTVIDPGVLFKTNTITETTASAGVTISVNTFILGTLAVNTITERTASAGVTISVDTFILGTLAVNTITERTALSGVTINKDLKATSGTSSTTTTTGAVIVTGGIGATGNINLGGNLVATGTLAGSNIDIRGSYIPTIGDGTNTFVHNVQFGGTVKFGNSYYITLTISWTGTGIAAGLIRISLPFTAIDSNDYVRQVFSVGVMTGFTFTGIEIVAVVDKNTNFLYLFINKNDGSASSGVFVSNAGTSGEVQISGWLVT